MGFLVDKFNEKMLKVFFIKFGNYMYNIVSFKYY